MWQQLSKAPACAVWHKQLNSPVADTSNTCQDAKWSFDDVIFKHNKSLSTTNHLSTPNHLSASVTKHDKSSSNLIQL
ncbi:hypothetical protein SLA2020_262130 [Shorea laevis]